MSPNTSASSTNWPSVSPQPPSTWPNAGHEILAFTGFPNEHWRQIWSTNPQERLNKEIRRRTDVVGTFPHRESVVRLIGAVLAEQNDEWADTRRYMTVEALLRADPIPITQELLLDKAA